MSIISAPDLLKLRNNHPHAGRFYLSFLKPTVVYCGTVTGAYTRGDRAITVTNVSGNIANCVEGNTIYVGTSCGDYSISRRRYRSRVGNVITLDENSVAWTAGQYITVVDNHELFPKYPYITDTSPFIFYKDKDIVYSNQNSNINPVAIAGAPKVGFLNGGSITFSITAVESYALASGATISSYSWSCTGGTIANSAIASTTITFTVAGQYWLKLTVTDSLGTSQSTYRRIYAHERTGANAPCLDFELVGNPSGSFDSSGWSMKVKLYNNADFTDVPDNTQVVLWYESFYNGSEHYIGANGNVRFVGYIKSETITTPVGSGYVEFDVYTAENILDSCNMYSISLEENATPNTWYKFPTGTLTVARAIHHLWKWHSTLLEMCDVFLPISNTKTMYACDDMENGTLLSLTNWTYGNGIFSKVCCDKIGRVHLQEDIIMLSDADQNAITEVMEILPIDRRGDVDIQYVRKAEYQYASVIASGVAMIAGVATPLISKAPGEVPNNRGQETYVVERLVLSSQSDLNRICGRLYAQLNREILEIRITLSGNYPIDIIPQEWFRITLPTDKRETVYGSIQLVCRTITDVIDMVAGTVSPECVFEMRVSSQDGITDAYTSAPEPPNSPLPPYAIPPYTPMPPITFPTSLNCFGVSIRIGSGANVLDLGERGFSEVPFNCIIDRIVLFADAVGSVVVDIRKATYALAPPTGANSIVGATPPTLSNAQKSFDITLTGWTRTLAKGDILSFNVNSVSTIKFLLISLTGRRI